MHIYIRVICIYSKYVCKSTLSINIIGEFVVEFLDGQFTRSATDEKRSLNDGIAFSRASVKMPLE